MCKGMGFLAYDVDAGHPLFSQIVACPTCGPGRQQQYLESICGMTSEMRGWTFANTEPTAKQRPVYQTAHGLAANPAWFLTLHGPYGTGKTRLLACIVNAGRANRWTSTYMTTAELLDHLRTAYHPDQKNLSFDGVWDRITTARILALDELDRWNPTEWAQEKFFELVDVRYRMGADHLTVFATNSAVDDLPGYLVSRMHDRRCQVYELAGVDMRQVRA